jgi:hypothetical protein
MTKERHQRREAEEMDSAWVPIAARVRTEPDPHSPAELYLDLMKRILTRALIARPRERQSLRPRGFLRRSVAAVIRGALAPLNFELVRLIPCTEGDYIESGHAARNRVEDAETMLGTRQLDNMQACITDVLEKDVPGDLLEAGVWRGGMTIFMRAALKALDDRHRQVWVVDSFEGLPEPRRGLDSFGWRAGEMAESLNAVRSNFARYGLLDSQVSFLKGFFNATLPTAPISKLSILRVDADLYESTMDALTHLYPRLSPGGYAIFDDYRNLHDCRRAIDEYRTKNGITEEIQIIDSRAVFWQKRS